MKQISFNKNRLLLIIVGLVAIVTFLVMGLLLNIFERKREAQNPFFRVVELTDSTTDPEIWGKNFPLQYDGYRRTVDMGRTRYGGSEAIRRAPSSKDPREVVAQSRLEEDPRLKTMWDGYAFAVDFREERGHAYMLEDQTFTERQHVAKQPGTCLNCHASMYTAYMEQGNGDLNKGFDKINALPYAQARALVSHPVSCIDCHDPRTMQLRVTRPAFIEGIKRAKLVEGVKDYDVNKMASRQEMRAFVCGQCHVEYYFKGDKKTLTYPWDKGLKATDILAYYDANPHTDWTHRLTGAKALKAQHPEFEMWNQGVHARAGVTCADCHMPYQRVGALKISDHHIRSPMLNVANACQTCHRVAEGELLVRVNIIQDRTRSIRDTAMNALMDLISDIQKAASLKAETVKLEKARDYQRRAQFLLDFVEAENSSGFHAPQEAARVLSESINYSRLGQMALR